MARSIRQSRQLVNYHLKELERAGLVERSGERRKGNFVEQLYRAVASRSSCRLGLRGVAPSASSALADQVSLDHLVAIGEQLQRDASALLDRAAFDGEQIESASVDARGALRRRVGAERVHDRVPRAARPAAQEARISGGNARFASRVAIYPNPTEDM